jgi:Tol biopolymer transport system component
LSRVLASDAFANAPSLSRFLAFVVDHTLTGKGSDLKEYTLGVEVFDRGVGFDPKLDTIVRVQARRLRSKLHDYYTGEGHDDDVVIDLEKGRYSPEFARRAQTLRPSFRTASPEIKLLRQRLDERPGWTPSSIARYLVPALAALAAVAVVVVRTIDSTRRPVTSPAEYVQLTDFTDSATAPALSADGGMVTFIRGGDAFLGHGQIYVKVLPGGNAVRLTSNSNRKFAPVFDADGSRVAYSEVQRDGTSSSWDTWTVPVLGGESSRLMPNATSLVWLDRLSVMFSEFKGKAGHLGIVAATEARADEHVIYFPAHERGMAHYSYASPDRKAVLVVEMDRDGTFQSCRLVPFDGTSPGRLVGPHGSCRFAAWSPDGKWMYFSAEVAGRSHLWRQASSSGAPEQITFGPTEEEGVAIAPDGRSLITSVGLRQSAIWIHDKAGDRPLSTEGYAFQPRFSRDARRVYYLFHESAETTFSELRSLDLASGKVESLVPRISISDEVGPNAFDISRDEKYVVFVSREPDGTRKVWLASLDRRTAPNVLATDGDYASFGGTDDDVFFVTLGEETSFFTRIKRDGTGRQRISDLSPIHNRGGISPDGQWAILYSPARSHDAPAGGTVAVPIGGGRGKQICSGLCWGWWSDDQRFLFVSIFDESSPELTLVIPLQPGVTVPDVPESGLNVPANRAAIPGIRIIDHGSAVPAPDPSTYVFVRTEFRRNLYRVPLH